ncbi:hypothetical protein GE09DRAFT_1211937 [Coniochaeta sp. 2T2.1]|nr:hypothetical protein GE09DRAFT_1211937 [Coniochaeta sp. 2T2.1]
MAGPYYFTPWSPAGQRAARITDTESMIDKVEAELQRICASGVKGKRQVTEPFEGGDGGGVVGIRMREIADLYSKLDELEQEGKDVVSSPSPSARRGKGPDKFLKDGDVEGRKARSGSMEPGRGTAVGSSGSPGSLFGLSDEEALSDAPDSEGSKGLWSEDDGDYEGEVEDGEPQDGEQDGEEHEDGELEEEGSVDEDPEDKALSGDQRLEGGSKNGPQEDEEEGEDEEEEETPARNSRTDSLYLRDPGPSNQPILRSSRFNAMGYHQMRAIYGLYPLVPSGPTKQAASSSRTPLPNSSQAPNQPAQQAPKGSRTPLFNSSVPPKWPTWSQPPAVERSLTPVEDCIMVSIESPPPQHFYTPAAEEKQARDDNDIKEIMKRRRRTRCRAPSPEEFPRRAGSAGPSAESRAARRATQDELRQARLDEWQKQLSPTTTANRGFEGPASDRSRGTTPDDKGPGTCLGKKRKQEDDSETVARKVARTSFYEVDSPPLDEDDDARDALLARKLQEDEDARLAQFLNDHPTPPPEGREPSELSEPDARHPDERRAAGEARPIGEGCEEPAVCRPETQDITEASTSPRPADRPLQHASDVSSHSNEDEEDREARLAKQEQEEADEAFARSLQAEFDSGVSPAPPWSPSNGGEERNDRSPTDLNARSPVPGVPSSPDFEPRGSPALNAPTEHARRRKNDGSSSPSQRKRRKLSSGDDGGQGDRSPGGSWLMMKIPALLCNTQDSVTSEKRPPWSGVEPRPEQYPKPSSTRSSPDSGPMYKTAAAGSHSYHFDPLMPWKSVDNPFTARTPSPPDEPTTNILIPRASKRNYPQSSQGGIKQEDVQQGPVAPGEVPSRISGVFPPARDDSDRLHARYRDCTVEEAISLARETEKTNPTTLTSTEKRFLESSAILDQKVRKWTGCLTPWRHVDEDEKKIYLMSHADDSLLTPGEKALKHGYYPAWLARNSRERQPECPTPWRHAETWNDFGGMLRLADASVMSELEWRFTTAWDEMRGPRPRRKGRPCLPSSPRHPQEDDKLPSGPAVPRLENSESPSFGLNGAHSTSPRLDSSDFEVFGPDASPSPELDPREFQDFEAFALDRKPRAPSPTIELDSREIQGDFEFDRNTPAPPPTPRPSFRELDFVRLFGDDDRPAFFTPRRTGQQSSTSAQVAVTLRKALKRARKVPGNKSRQQQIEKEARAFLHRARSLLHRTTPLVGDTARPAGLRSGTFHRRRWCSSLDERERMSINIAISLAGNATGERAQPNENTVGTVPPDSTSESVLTEGTNETNPDIPEKQPDASQELYEKRRGSWLARGPPPAEKFLQRLLKGWWKERPEEKPYGITTNARGKRKPHKHLPLFPHVSVLRPAARKTYYDIPVLEPPMSGDARFLLTRPISTILEASEASFSSPVADGQPSADKSEPPVDRARPRKRRRCHSPPAFDADDPDL